MDQLKQFSVRKTPQDEDHYTLADDEQRPKTFKDIRDEFELKDASRKPLNYSDSLKFAPKEE